MNGYELSRAFFDWSFENPNKINPNHIALYFFCIEHCNRLGWKDKFGLPTTMAKEAIGIRSYNTYKKTLEDLVEFGFVEMIEVSKNQYSSNIIALKENIKAPKKALDKALLKHASKQLESTGQSTHQSTDSINKQINKEQVNNRTEKAAPPNVFLNNLNLIELSNLLLENQQHSELFAMLYPKLDFKATIEQFYTHKVKGGVLTDSYNNFTKHFFNWLKVK